MTVNDFVEFRVAGETMAYKIPGKVKRFRSRVPAGNFFVLLHERRAHAFLVGRCVRAHPKDFETYDDAVTAADKLVTPELLAVVYEAVKEISYSNTGRAYPYIRFQQWRICDGTDRPHSRPTTKERLMIQQAIQRRGANEPDKNRP